MTDTSWFDQLFPLKCEPNCEACEAERELSEVCAEAIDGLAEEAIREYERGETIPLSDLIAEVAS